MSSMRLTAERCLRPQDSRFSRWRCSPRSTLFRFCSCHRISRPQGVADPRLAMTHEGQLLNSMSKRQGGEHTDFTVPVMFPGHRGIKVLVMNLRVCFVLLFAVSLARADVSLP